MLLTIFYGFSIGAILYFISIGLSLTFGTMRVVNFAHTLTYSIGVYVLITCIPLMKGNFFPAGIIAVLAVIPISYIIERFVIRRPYGESLDYTFIATFAITLMGVDTIKWVWGVNPLPLSAPLGTYVEFWGMTFPVYRILIFAIAIALFLGLELFFKRTIMGKIVVAALEDKDGVRCLGVRVDKYFSIMFILGSALAALGGVLYAPISAVVQYVLDCLRALRRTRRGLPRRATGRAGAVQRAHPAGPAGHCLEFRVPQLVSEADGRNFTIWPYSTWRTTGSRRARSMPPGIGSAGREKPRPPVTWTDGRASYAG